MNKPDPLLIRADSGGDLGTGHVMRMIALAQAWQDRGGTVTLAVCQCPPALIERVRAENISFVPLGDLPLGGQEDLSATASLATSLSARWVVIDGYHFSTDYQKGLKSSGFKVLAIDDYGHCETWHADIVLNQNLSETGEMLDHTNDEGEPTHLLGVQYALLRREFRTWAKETKRDDALGTRLLITFGGVDPDGATLRILKGLASLPDLPLQIKVLAGPANARVADIEEMASNSPHAIEIIPAVLDMPSLYSWADRVISAGGSSCYEWMFFRLPGWVTSIAENQNRIVQVLLERNLACGVPRISATTDVGLSLSLEKWLLNPSPPRSAMIDGHGALRAAAELSEARCWLRPADFAKDAEFLYNLANDPAVRSAGRHTDNIPWQDHVAWLQCHCASDASRLLIIEHSGRGPAGLVRMHQDQANTWEIGISIHPAFRKLRLASSALAIAMRAYASSLGVAEWKAQIRDWNHASQGLMKKLGFTPLSEKNGMQVWTMTTENS
jgi:UDP-2,4-diacetamido-2,4,6-trideoxy-beta-L-altropyranose hydrolase